MQVRRKVAAKSIDAYLRTLGAGQRAALERLRRSIQKAAPEAEEGISYGLPAFRLHGRPLVAFGAATKHCSFYPMSPAVIDAHKSQLEAYETSKGTIRIPWNSPLPDSLVRKLVRARIAEIAPSALRAAADAERDGLHAARLARPRTPAPSQRRYTGAV